MNLKRLVNDIELYGSFLEYIDTLIEEDHKRLEYALDADELRRLQGSIRTLRKLSKLKEALNGR